MSREVSVLIIDDEEPGRLALQMLLKNDGFSVSSSGSGAEAIALMGQNTFKIIIADLFLPDMNGIDILRKAKSISPDSEVIMITGYASAESAVTAMKEGAFDYIVKPVNYEELRIVVRKALEKQDLLSENVYLKEQLRERFEFSNIIGNSSAMHSLFERMARVARTDSTVLITGESGTGKELVAKALHFNGTRREKPFIALNCGAIPETLLESELFGHVKGAFTGAIRDKAGKFEAANGGTLFLDEIGTMPLHLQTKLLRVLQEQEVEPVGGTKTLKLDVRVISATNLDLAEEVRKGGFREDLYYRLNVIPLNLPPLRERTEDIMPLVRHFLGIFCRKMSRKPMTLNRKALEALENYDWPGNVRELENLVERLAALTEGDVIRLEDIPSSINAAGNQDNSGRITLTEQGIDLTGLVADIERKLITDAMALSGGVKARAAQLLGINRTTLVEKMKRLMP